MEKVFVLRVKRGITVYSMRIFTSLEKMDLYINNHPLPLIDYPDEIFYYDCEDVICDPID